jgi:hypothetical protein
MNCKKPCKENQICNPKSGRCVSLTGKIGRTLKSRSLRKKTKSRSLSKSHCKKPCKVDQICNPASGRCVSRSGKIGKGLISLKSPKRKSRSPVKSPKRKSQSPVKSYKRKSRLSYKNFQMKSPEEYYGSVPKNVTKDKLADIMAKGLKKLAEHSDATNSNIYNPSNPTNDLLRWLNKWIINDTKKVIFKDDLLFKPTDDGKSDDYGKEFFNNVRIKLEKLFSKKSRSRSHSNSLKHKSRSPLNSLKCKSPKRLRSHCNSPKQKSPKSKSPDKQIFKYKEYNEFITSGNKGMIIKVKNNEIYDYNDKKPNPEKLWYFWNRKNYSAPIMNIYFRTQAGWKNYIKNNKESLKSTIGKIGTDFFVAVAKKI